MLEEALGVFGSDRRERRAYRIQQSLLAPGRGPAQQVLDLGERLFYGVVVWRVGWQIEQLTALLLDELPDPLGSMCSEVVHHHDLSWLKARYEHLLDVGLEDSGGGRPFYG